MPPLCTLTALSALDLSGCTALHWPSVRTVLDAIGGTLQNLNLSGPSITHYKANWLASNIWIRDEFCYRIPAPWCRGSQPKLVSNPDSVIKILLPFSPFLFSLFLFPGLSKVWLFHLEHVCPGLVLLDLSNCTELVVGNDTGSLTTDGTLKPHTGLASLTSLDLSNATFSGDAGSYTHDMDLLLELCTGKCVWNCVN